ncbi:pseudouridine synthase [Leptospira ellisii]
MNLFEMEESMSAPDEFKKEEGIRINRYLADCGLGSRRKTEELVLGGGITINGKIVTSLSTRVRPGVDRVTYKGETIFPLSESSKLLILNKPAGYLCSHRDRFHEKTVFSLLPESYRHYKIAGRLDLNSRGLLLLTNDGELAQKISHPSQGSEKEYLVWLRDDPGEKSIRASFQKGILDAGEVLRAKMVKLLPGASCVYRVVLGEGKKRQIRRMFQASGTRVLDLQRIRVGSIELEKLNLKEGEFLLRDADEVWE